jgi:homospermidine synthase
MSSFANALNESNSKPLNILIIGFGVVGKGVLVGLQKYFKNVNGTILDMSAKVIEDGENSITNEFVNPSNTWKFQQLHIDSSNYEEILSSLTTVGSIIVETCVEVNTADALKWSLKNGRHFTNTVCDKWKEETLAATNHYKNIHGILREYVLPVAKVIRDENIPANPLQPTCLIGNGANIGMVNHYFKKALSDASKAWNMSVEEALSQLKGVYIFEKDTIVFKKDFIPQPNIFYNTWNVLEFHLESVAHVDYPPETETHELESMVDDNNNVTYNKVKNVWYDRAMVRDIRLNDTIVHGRVVSHEETYSLADYCLRKTQKHPEVQFIYECSPIGEVARVTYPLGPNYTPVCVSTHADFDQGSDLVGTLIIMKDGRSWSTYYNCMQSELPNNIKMFTNATAWYVSCGVLSSILFLREFPSQGAGFPEDFDIQFNEVVIRNFETFVSECQLSKVISQDESHMMKLSPAYATYECVNNF